MTQSEPSYGQRLRDKGVSLGKGTTPTRNRSAGGEKPHYNSWEAGIARDHRGMPYLDGQGHQIGTKRFAEKYRAIAEERDRRNAAHPPPPKE